MAGAQGSALAVAGCNAGALGSLPCAMVGPEALRSELVGITSTGPVHRAALKSAGARCTAMTNLFSGGAARGIINRAMRELGPMTDLAPEFPLTAAAMAPLRAKAEAAVRPEPRRSPRSSGNGTHLNPGARHRLNARRARQTCLVSPLFSRFFPERRKSLRVSVGRSERNSRCCLSGQNNKQIEYRHETRK